MSTLRAIALTTCLCACGSDASDGTDPDASSLDAAGDDTATTDGTATDTGTATDSGTATDTGAATEGGADATTDSGATKDTAPPPLDAPIDGGPSCTFTKDADGFFSLKSPKSDYWVRLPAGYDATKPTALVFGFHGCGDTARNFATWAIVPYALRASHKYIGASLGGREGACWTVSTDTAVAMAALDHLRSCFAVDPKKIVLAGYSSGGAMAFNIGLKSAASYAGLLIENSGLSQAVGGSNVATVLGAAAWKIHIGQSARIGDGSYAIAGIRTDRDKMLGASFPLEYRELDGTHDGTSDDWALFLLPKIATWTAP
ncbi:MAG: hypothetical protein IPJ34_26805 [Myxococcales bacterium]|nr:hypothetical protein [Myxococcales bacterium]